jgi:hypothetical protein
MCEHAETFDHYDFGAPGLQFDLCTRQCLECLHCWRVVRPDAETPIPSRQQVLADVATWKLQRELYEGRLGFR